MLFILYPNASAIAIGKKGDKCTIDAFSELSVFLRFFSQKFSKSDEIKTSSCYELLFCLIEINLKILVV